MNKYRITIRNENKTIHKSVVFSDDETTAFLLVKSQAEKLGKIIPDECWVRTENL